MNTKFSIVLVVKVVCGQLECSTNTTRIKVPKVYWKKACQRSPAGIYVIMGAEMMSAAHQAAIIALCTYSTTNHCSH